MEIHNLTDEEFIQWLGVHHPTLAARVGQLLENTEELTRAVNEDNNERNKEDAYESGQEEYRRKVRVALAQLMEDMEAGNL
jgi:hypothetical protein